MTNHSDTGGQIACFNIAADLVPTTSIHLAFQAQSIEHMHAFYQAGISAGGKDNGEPGYREYHGSYYAAFLLDPDGNNIEAVCDVGSERPSYSVIVTRRDNGE